VRADLPGAKTNSSGGCLGIALRLMAGDKGAPIHAPLLSRNSDEETDAETDGLLVASGKTVVVSRFEEPAETVFAGRPEHEVSRYFPRDGVGHFPVLSEVDPYGADTHHELCLP
jgi:hypothetical protein